MPGCLDRLGIMQTHPNLAGVGAELGNAKRVGTHLTEKRNIHNGQTFICNKTVGCAEVETSRLDEIILRFTVHVVVFFFVVAIFVNN